MTAVFAGTVCSVGYTRIKQISMRKKIHDNINGAGGRKSRLYVGWVVTIVIAFLIVIPVRRFCVESYRISTSAMEDALHQGDYILVNKLPLEGNPGRNKVVLFTMHEKNSSCYEMHIIYVVWFGWYDFCQ